MIVKLSNNILFSIIIFLIGFQNIAIADQIPNQIIKMNLSPSDAYIDKTTTFTTEFTSAQNLSFAVIHFYMDAEKKGAKSLFFVEKNKKYFITFDNFFDKSSHFGEHYIELKIDYVTENQKNGTENFYTVVNIYDNKKGQTAIFETILLYFLPFLFLAVVIGSIVHSKHSKDSVIKFDPGDRKTLFNFILTSLPISISIFTLYITGKPELKIGMISIFLSLLTSLIFALYVFILAEKESDTKANNFTVYSLCFLFLALIEMILLVLVF